MIEKLLSSLAFASLLVVSATAQAQTSTWTIDPAHSSINFQIRHLGVSNVRGSFGGVKGTVQLNESALTNSSVSATIDTNTVTTSSAKRDEDLKSAKFFDVTKNPQMTFKSTRLSNSGGKLQMTGDLTLNGTTKSVTLDLDGPAPPQKNPQGKTVSGFSASGMIKRSDFAFAPSYPAAAIGDEVKFTIDIEMDKQ